MYPSYFLPSFIASHDLIEPHERFDLPSLEKKKSYSQGSKRSSCPNKSCEAMKLSKKMRGNLG